MSRQNRVSLVIPCKDDPLIERCIDSSIGVDEIVVVFNGSPQEYVNTIKKRLAKRHVSIRYFELAQPNLAWALEYGSRMAKYSSILYMDSDCVFADGAIEAFKAAIFGTDISANVLKGEVVFDKGTTAIEKVIAKSRTHHTAEVLTAYKPPLLVSKKILPKIGGYFFDSRLIWREDSDLDNRVRKGGIGILPVKDGTIFHKKITLKTDLRSTFRYGIGLALANAMNITLTEVPRSVMSTLHSQGLAPAIYMVFRNRVYDAGYWYARVAVRLFSKKFGNHQSTPTEK